MLRRLFFQSRPQNVYNLIEGRFVTPKDICVVKIYVYARPACVSENISISVDL